MMGWKIGEEAEEDDGDERLGRRREKMIRWKIEAGEDDRDGRLRRRQGKMMGMKDWGGGGRR